MKLCRALLVFAAVIFQSSFCFAADFVNFSFMPDPSSHCHQYAVDVAITETSTLGVNTAPECNSDRTTYGPTNANVSNKFSRVMIAWKYAPHGAFKDGYFFDSEIGAEQSAFTSVAGSSANVALLISGFMWDTNGFGAMA